MPAQYSLLRQRTRRERMHLGFSIAAIMNSKLPNDCPELNHRENCKRIVLNSSLPTPLNINASIVDIMSHLHGLNPAREAIDYARG